MAKSVADSIKKRGRPFSTGVGKLIGVRLLPDAIERVDDWIKHQAKPKPSRPEAIRQLLASALDAYRERTVGTVKPTQLIKIPMGHGGSSKPDSTHAERNKTEPRMAPSQPDKVSDARQMALGSIDRAMTDIDATDEEKTERTDRLTKYPAVVKKARRKSKPK
jgi:hypothetical protein